MKQFVTFVVAMVIALVGGVAFGQTTPPMTKPTPTLPPALSVTLTGQNMDTHNVYVLVKKQKLMKDILLAGDLSQLKKGTRLRAGQEVKEDARIGVAQEIPVVVDDRRLATDIVLGDTRLIPPATVLLTGTEVAAGSILCVDKNYVVEVLPPNVVLPSGTILPQGHGTQPLQTTKELVIVSSELANLKDEVARLKAELAATSNAAMAAATRAESAATRAETAAGNAGTVVDAKLAGFRKELDEYKKLIESDSVAEIMTIDGCLYYRKKGETAYTKVPVGYRR